MEYIKNNKISFGTRLETGKVLEVTSKKIFYSNGIEGVRDVVKALSDKPIKATGHKGYKYFAEQIGFKILQKYPQIAEATEKINQITTLNPHIKKGDLAREIAPLIEKIGKEIDITI